VNFILLLYQVDDFKNYYASWIHGSIIYLFFPLLLQKSRGFGFVTFAEHSAAENVLKQSEHFINNTKVYVRLATPSDKYLHKIFIGGVSMETTASDIKEYFSQFGKLGKVLLMSDENNANHRGYGFILFEDKNVATRVCEMQNHTLKTCCVRCRPALPKNSSSIPNIASDEETESRMQSLKITDQVSLTPRARPNEGYGNGAAAAVQMRQRLHNVGYGGATQNVMGNYANLIAANLRRYQTTPARDFNNEHLTRLYNPYTPLARRFSPYRIHTAVPAPARSQGSPYRLQGNNYLPMPYLPRNTPPMFHSANTVPMAPIALAAARSRMSTHNTPLSAVQRVTPWAHTHMGIAGGFRANLPPFRGRGYRGAPRGGFRPAWAPNRPFRDY
jgi:RNA recognition motif-containing protein